MENTDALIHDVSDTSLWVAHYRAKESKRPDALFKDPFAEILVGERGKKIAEDMNRISRFSEWTVIIRTVVIDAFIQKAIQEYGVDMILNLGAGMDTRPYRMNLPSTLKWIEVDYPHILAHKEKLLKSETPACELSRVAIDLADDQKRKSFFKQTASRSSNILVLTEGVVLYMSEDQVGALADDLNHFPSFNYWVVEYLHSKVYPHLKNSFRANKMRNAPFQFFPADWLGFFEQRGWTPKILTYLGEVGSKLGRPMPLPFLASLFKIFNPKAMHDNTVKMNGFILLEKKE
ncbi:MAG TPA: SAM-dependent methyltransferase [Bacteroidia bacterium]|jgi:methyltransferase (TIGR00027 family)|nr:SAM-dependent methyltransferase [Bacteroidia bacterium]